MSRLAGRDLRVVRAGRTILADATLSVGPGELVGLIGPNGAGKTTLLRCLAGLIRPDGGGVSLCGRDIASVPRAALARRVAYLAQGAEVNWPLTVDRAVALGRLPHIGPWQRPGAADAAVIADAMERCGVSDLKERPVTTLSGGERARVLLARALAVRPEVLLADEPVAGLDPHHQLRVMDVLAGLAGDGAAVVVVLHDLTLAARYCGRVVLLDKGAIVADGPTGEALRTDLLEAVYGVGMVPLDVDGTRILLPWRHATPDR